MGQYLKIGEQGKECDYNVQVIENMTFEEFKNEGSHSFSKGKTDQELQYIYDLILGVNGDAKRPEEKTEKPSRKRSETGKPGDSGQQ